MEEAGLRHILARHKQGAVFMADGYAQDTGREGVVFVITGHSLCNIMTALEQAYSDSDHVFGCGGASRAGCATAVPRPRANGGRYLKSYRDAALGEKAVGYFRGSARFP